MKSVFYLLLLPLSASFYSCKPDRDTAVPPEPKVSTLVDSTAGMISATGVCIDKQGNVYIADMGSHKIFKLTPTGTFTQFSGTTQGYADGMNSVAKFDRPTGVACDKQGNIYVADMGNHRIRKVSTTGQVSTLAGTGPGYADGPGNGAKFWFPVGLCIDPEGNIYVADQINCRIRKVTPAGLVTNFVGAGAGVKEGKGTEARFGFPTAISQDEQGFFYVADYENDRIRKITPDANTSTFAGGKRGYRDSTGTGASFNRPFGVCNDASGNVYVADLWNNLIRKITSNGQVSTLGSGKVGNVNGNLSTAAFVGPKAVCLDLTGNLLVLESTRLKKIQFK